MTLFKQLSFMSGINLVPFDPYSTNLWKWDRLLKSALFIVLPFIMYMYKGPSYYLICIFWAFQANLICSSNCNRTILVQLKTRPSVVLKSAYHASKPNWAKLRAADLALSKLICWTRWTYLKLSCFGSNLLIIMLFQTHLIDSYTILRPIWETYDSQIICKFHYV